MSKKSSKNVKFEVYVQGLHRKAEKSIVKFQKKTQSDDKPGANSVNVPIMFYLRSACSWNSRVVTISHQMERILRKYGVYKWKDYDVEGIYVLKLRFFLYYSNVIKSSPLVKELKKGKKLEIVGKIRKISERYLKDCERLKRGLLKEYYMKKIKELKNGAAKSKQSFVDGSPNSAEFGSVYVPKRMADEFLNYAFNHNSKGVQFYGLLYGRLDAREFQVTRCVIPMQKGNENYVVPGKIVSEEFLLEAFSSGLVFLGRIYLHVSGSSVLSPVNLLQQYGHQTSGDFTTVANPNSILVGCFPDSSEKFKMFRIRDETMKEIRKKAKGISFSDNPKKLEIDYPQWADLFGTSSYEECSFCTCDYKKNVGYKIVDLRKDSSVVVTKVDYGVKMKTVKGRQKSKRISKRKITHLKSLGSVIQESYSLDLLLPIIEDKESSMKEMCEKFVDTPKEKVQKMYKKIMNAKVDINKDIKRMVKRVLKVDKKKLNSVRSRCVLYFKNVKRLLKNTEDSEVILHERKKLRKQIDTLKKKKNDLEVDLSSDDLFEVEDDGEDDILDETTKRNLEFIKNQISEKQLELSKKMGIVYSHFVKKKLMKYLQLRIEREKTMKNKFIRYLIQKGIYVRDRSLDDYTDLMLLQQNRGEVYKCRLRGDDSKKWKCVKILLAGKDKNSKKVAINEIKNLLKLDHPSIIKIEKVFSYSSPGGTKMGIEMDFVGVDLLKWLKGKKYFQVLSKKMEMGYGSSIGEEELKKILTLPNVRGTNLIKTVFRKILEAICYCHDHDLQYRDLKPQNCVISQYNDVKLIDFGCSTSSLLPTLTCIRDAASPRYDCPEKKRTKKSDIWSYGQMFFECFARGKDVMKDTKHPAFHNFVKKSSYLKRDEKELIIKTLERSVEKRISARNALNLEFFKFKEGGSLFKEKYEEDKVKNFYRIIEKKTRIIHNKRRGFTEISLNRDDLIEDVVELFEGIKGFDNLSKLRTVVKFYRLKKGGSKEVESGLDAGGLTREMYFTFVRQMEDEKNELVDSMNTNGTLFLPSDYKDHEKFFRNFGKIVAKSFVEKINLRFHFGPLIFIKLFKKSPKTFDDYVKLLRSYDNKYYEYLIEGVEKELQKLVSTKSYKVNEVFSFVGNDGEIKKLSIKNREEFLVYKIKEKIYGYNFREKNIQAFIDGFFGSFPSDICVYILQELNPLTLERMICGADSISKKVLMNNVRFSGDKEIDGFVKMWIEESTESDRRELVHFVTGSDAIDSDGQLKLLGKAQKIIIKPSSRIFSHTCSFTLEIDRSIGSYEIFKKVLNENYLRCHEKAAFYE